MLESTIEFRSAVPMRASWNTAEYASSPARARDSRVTGVRYGWVLIHTSASSGRMTATTTYAQTPTSTGRRQRRSSMGVRL